MKKIAILGGGAAGLAAAITVARECPGASVFLYEKNPTLGKKLLATGNGRCNLGNGDLRPSCYHGDTTLVNHVLDRFTTEDSLAFFGSLGLSTLVEEGRIYPQTLAAASVQQVLVQEVERLGIHVISSFELSSLEPTETGFQINQTISADAVILALGGKAGAKYGTDGDVYRLLKSLNIRYQPIAPALVPLTVKEDLSPLHGVRVRGSIQLETLQGTLLGKESGELQFTSECLSGIAVMQLSGMAAVLTKKEPLRAKLDLCPSLAENTLLSYLKERKTVCGKEPAEHLLVGILNQKMAATLLRISGIGKDATALELTDTHLAQLADAIKHFPLTVTGTKSYKDAQVTHGGVGADQLKEGSLESKDIPGLFFAGELLNVDGICGGYNLHFAWGTGILAAKEVVKFAAD